MSRLRTGESAERPVKTWTLRLIATRRLALPTLPPPSRVEALPLPAVLNSRRISNGRIRAPPLAITYENCVNGRMIHLSIGFVTFNQEAPPPSLKGSRRRGAFEHRIRLLRSRPRIFHYLWQPALPKVCGQMGRLLDWQGSLISEA